VSREASGKGLNVSWALHKQGLETLAVFPAGGQTSEFMKDTLGGASLPHLVVPVGAEVRTNITLRVNGSPDTKINTSSDSLTTAEIDAYLGAISTSLQNARVLVSSGSLPPGAPVTLHRDIIALGKKAGVFTVVDSSGEALVEALTQGPDLVKPNREELEELTGRTVITLGDVVGACEEVRALGAGAVLASLGNEGVVLVDSLGVLVGSVTGVVARNTIGAGDALLAGFIATLDDRVAQLTRALVWASSAVQSESTLFDVDRAIEDNVSVSATWDADTVLGTELPETTSV
jgi:1-phosphofructokinase